MSPIAEAPPTARLCYLPHHGVLRGSGTEAKIRVVFNGSSRTSEGTSLNAALQVGPNLLPALADILTRWHRYVFVADVEKMYRQVLMHPDDRDLQRILWIEKKSISEFQLNTVTYGLACAPYLAMRVMRQLAADEENRFPHGAEAIRSDTYMDDILSGADTLDSCRQRVEQVTALCMAGGFPLRKWAANHGTILRDVPREHCLVTCTDARLPSAEHSILGLRWNPETDDFALAVQEFPRAAATKRTVLSRTARLFDPLGWLSPITTRAKLLIQAAWLQQLDWDAPLPERETAMWTSLEEELPLLRGVRIPRWTHSDSSACPVELHGFSDASELAYAAVVYLRTVRSRQPVISIVAARSKVAPLKRVSIPRLELCAAALLSKLIEHVRTTLSLQSSAVHLWTDSTVVLGRDANSPTAGNGQP